MWIMRLFMLKECGNIQTHKQPHIHWQSVPVLNTNTEFPDCNVSLLKTLAQTDGSVLFTGQSASGSADQKQNTSHFHCTVFNQDTQWNFAVIFVLQEDDVKSIEWKSLELLSSFITWMRWTYLDSAHQIYVRTSSVTTNRTTCWGKTRGKLLTFLAPFERTVTI